jgi:hypothetical protein
MVIAQLRTMRREYDLKLLPLGTDVPVTPPLARHRMFQSRTGHSQIEPPGSAADCPLAMRFVGRTGEVAVRLDSPFRYVLGERIEPGAAS